MATRTISTKLAIEGEDTYRASVSNINASLKVLQSQLKEVESRFLGQENSMDAVSAKGKALAAIEEAQRQKVEEVARALENAENAVRKYGQENGELKARLEKNSAALGELGEKTEKSGERWNRYAKTVSDSEEKLLQLKKTSGDTTEEQEKLHAKVDRAKAAMERLDKSTNGAAKEAGRLLLENKELNAELASNSQKAAAAEKGVSSWTIALNRAKTDLNKVTAELKKTQDAYEGVSTALNKTEQQQRKAKTTATAMQANIASLAVALSDKLGMALRRVYETVTDCIRASTEFESAMAGVKKTTDLTDEELSAMGDQFKALSTEIPISAVEFANIAEAAGQLGIQKESIIGFTKTMANLGVATNMTAEDAATLLAQFTNVTGMDPSKYENLGSVITDLGNNLATTESKIVDMSQRLAGAGTLAGLTEPEIMALAGAMSSVGIEAEAGGTAMTQTLTGIEKAVTKGGEKLEGFARIAGMSSEEFSTTWKNEPIKAVEAFIGGLGKMEEAGESSTIALEDLGIKGVRQTNMLKSLGKASELLGSSIGIANIAWEENTALAKEAETRYETTESKFTMFKNSVENLKAAVGDQLNPTLAGLAEAGTDAAKWAADFVEQNEAVVPAIAAVATGIAVLAGGAVIAKIATAELTKTILAASVAAMSNPFVLAAAAVAALGTAIFAAAANAAAGSPEFQELTQDAKNLQDALKEQNKIYEDTVSRTEAAAQVAETYIEKLEKLEAAGVHTKEQQEEYHNTLLLLCQAVPELAQYIDLENDAIEGGTAALRKNTEAWKNNAIQQAYQERLTEVYKEYTKVQTDAQISENKLNEALAKKESAIQNITAAEERQLELEKQMDELREKAFDGDEQAAEKLQGLAEEYGMLSDSIFEYSEQLSQAEEDEKSYQRAKEENSDALAEASEAVRDTEEAVKELTDTQAEGTKQAEEYSAASENIAISQEEQEAASKSLKKMCGELEEEYKASYEAAYSAISGTAGLFGDFAYQAAESANLSVDEMAEHWRTQAENIGNYTMNLEKAAKYGITEGLVAALSDGSEDSAAYIATIVGKIEELGGSTEGMSEEAKKFVDGFNSEFERTEQAKESYARTLVSLKSQTDETFYAIGQAAKEYDLSDDVTAMLENAFANAGVNYAGIGENVANGVSKGISDNAASVGFSAEEMAEMTLETLRARFGIHSPSTVTKEMGINLDAGLIGGIEEKGPDVIRTVQKQGEKIADIMEQSAKKSVAQFSNALSPISQRTRAILENLKETVGSAINSLPGSFEYTGAQMVNGMIQGIYSRSSSLYATVSSVVSGAIAAGNQAAKVKSPSQKTIEMFQHVGDGMIEGIKSRREKVAESTRDVVENALKIDMGSSLREAVLSIDTMNLSLQELQTANIGGSARPIYVEIKSGAVQIDSHGENGEDLYQSIKERLDYDVRKAVRAGGSWT